MTFLPRRRDWDVRSRLSRLGRNRRRGLRGAVRWQLRCNTGAGHGRQGINEAIADTRHSLDKARRVGIVAEHFPQSRDCVVQPVIEVDQDIRWPHPPAQLFARDNLIGPLEERHEQLKWLLLQVNALSVSNELASGKIDYKKV